MQDRRAFLHKFSKLGLAAATSPLWSSPFCKQAFAQSSQTKYKAIVVITLVGGNDGNNLLIPLDPKEYQEYALLRSSLALPASSCLPLPTTSGLPIYGLNPALVNVAGLFARKRAAVVANIGPLVEPVSKQQLQASASLYPQSVFGHPECQQHWESATTILNPATGWGGRIADLIFGDSGSLPPVLNTAVNSIFCTGASIQGIAVQSGGAYPALPSGINDVILRIAQNDSASKNLLVSQLAQFRVNASKQQAIVNQAMAYQPVAGSFTSTAFGKSMQSIADLLAGRSVIEASRQIFYAQQIGFDTHEDQLGIQNSLLADLDQNLGSFFTAIDSFDLSDQVLVCTHSDFCRSMTANISGGSDHAWGNYQLIMGGGIQGGRIIGTVPILELDGPDDCTGLGVWIPTLSVTQMTASIGAWLGLTHAQVTEVFPDIVKFPGGPIKL